VKVEVLNFDPFCKGALIGFLDCRVTYDVEKWEIFRNLSVLQKDGKRWISFGAVKREEKWLPKYERNTDSKPLLMECLKAYEEYVGDKIQVDQNGSFF